MDVTVALGDRRVAELVAILDASGFEARVPEPAAFAETSRVLPVVHRPTRMPADVILAGPGLEERFLAQAEARTIEDVVVPVASAPDLVVMKVLAERPQDLEDATAVLRERRPVADTTDARWGEPGRRDRDIGPCPPEKREAIEEALRHFGMI